MNNEIAKTINPVRENKDIPVIEVTYLSGKKSQGVLGNPKGVHSSPSLNTPCVLIKVDSSNKIVIPLNTARPTDLVADDMAIFAHNLASMIKLLANGEMKINADNIVEINTKKVIINADVEVNGNITATGTIKGQTDVIMGPSEISGKDHTHSGVDEGIGNSGPPNS